MANRWITEADLAYARECVLVTLAERCNVERRQLSQDGRGGFAESWQQVQVDVPCRFAARTGRETFLPGREVAIGDWILTLEHDTELKAQDRIYHLGESYEVTFIDGAKSHNTATRALLRLVE